MFNVIGGDEKYEHYFLDKCQPVLNEDDILLLNNDLAESEIWNAIKYMCNNKSPGSDGLPIEFYKKSLEYY